MSYSKIVGLIPLRQTLLNMELGYQQGGSASLHHQSPGHHCSDRLDGEHAHFSHECWVLKLGSFMLSQQELFSLKQLQENLVVRLHTAYKRIGKAQISDSSAQDPAETPPPPENRKAGQVQIFSLLNSR